MKMREMLRKRSPKIKQTTTLFGFQLSASSQASITLFPFLYLLISTNAHEVPWDVIREELVELTVVRVRKMSGVGQDLFNTKSPPPAPTFTPPTGWRKLPLGVNHKIKKKKKKGASLLEPILSSELRPPRRSYEKLS